MKRKPLYAVHDQDLHQFLTSLGILSELEAGRLTCAVCGDVVTLENFQGVYPEGDKIRVICQKPDCFSKALRKEG